MTDVSADLQKWHEKIIANMTKAMYNAGVMVEEESVRRCPMDTGKLRQRHTTIVDPNTLTATIVYEHNIPESEQYGLRVHECPSSIAAYQRNVALKRYRHGKPERGIPWDQGEDHFLRNALTAKSPEINEYLKKAMKECCKK